MTRSEATVNMISDLPALSTPHYRCFPHDDGNGSRTPGGKIRWATSKACSLDWRQTPPPLKGNKHIISCKEIWFALICLIRKACSSSGLSWSYTCVCVVPMDGSFYASREIVGKHTCLKQPWVECICLLQWTQIHLGNHMFALPRKQNPAIQSIACYFPGVDEYQWLYILHPETSLEF